ncbi:hypothetical protein JW824_05775 [bacterium]|nr:hypothetical protein [bacterium]RQV95973.1 MAG: hypothetical protein EH221_05335 [bacterium]
MDELTKTERRTLERVARMNLKLRKIIAYVFIIVAWLAILIEVIYRKGNSSMWLLAFIFIITAFGLSNLHWASICQKLNAMCADK